MVKVKKEYVLRQMAGRNIVVKLDGEAPEGKGVFALNDSGAFIWNLLKSGADESRLLRAVRETYEVDEKQAMADVAEFIERLRLLNALED